MLLSWRLFVFRNLSIPSRLSRLLAYRLYIPFSNILFSKLWPLFLKFSSCWLSGFLSSKAKLVTPSPTPTTAVLSGSQELCRCLSHSTCCAAASFSLSPVSAEAFSSPCLAFSSSGEDYCLTRCGNDNKTCFGLKKENSPDLRCVNFTSIFKRKGKRQQGRAPSFKIRQTYMILKKYLMS